MYWIAIAPEYREQVKTIIRFIGYTSEIYRLIKPDDIEEYERIIWKKQDYDLFPVYVENPVWIRSRAPDKRTFLLMNDKGEIVPITGYRGDGKELSSRGLPPEDARMLVNLVTPAENSCSVCTFLDPFAGIGGLVLEAVDQNFKVFSGDIDTKVQYGIHNITQQHVVLDTANLPYRNETFSSIASELPFHVQSADTLDSFISEMHRVLKPNGKIALMVVQPQMLRLEQKAVDLHLQLLLKENINRKGTDVWICTWQKLSDT